MRIERWLVTAMALLSLGAGPRVADAGDSLYGRVTEVKSAERVTFDYGEGRYELRLVGIDVPREEALSRQATELVAKLVRGKNARMRFEGRTEGGDMLARLFTDDPEIGIREVAVELVRAGLVRKQKGVDFKYGELAAAEREARQKRLGLWATTPPR